METIQCFKEENNLDISPELANEYLNSMSGLFLAFEEKHSRQASTEAGEVLSVDKRDDSTRGISNTSGTLQIAP
jgi:hypothetical protein